MEILKMRRIWWCCAPFWKSLVVSYAFYLHFLRVPNSYFKSVMSRIEIHEDYWDQAPNSQLCFSMTLLHHNVVPIQVPLTWCLFKITRVLWGRKSHRQRKSWLWYCGEVDPGWMPCAHQSRPIAPLHSWTRERKYNECSPSRRAWCSWAGPAWKEGPKHARCRISLILTPSSSLLWSSEDIWPFTVCSSSPQDTEGWFVFP